MAHASHDSEPERFRPKRISPRHLDIEEWRQRSFIQQPVQSVQRLLDIAEGRLEVINILCINDAITTAGDDLIELTREAYARRKGGAAETDYRDVVDRWLSDHHLDAAEWTRDWATRVCAMVVDTLNQHANTHGADTLADLEINADDFLDVDAGAIPLPSRPHLERELLTDAGGLWDWAFDEYPPQPDEPEEQFLARMKKAWQRRRKLLHGGGKQRKITRHAEWFVRVHVCGQSIETLLHENPKLDDRTIPKALKSFAALVEIPFVAPRTRKRK